MNDRIDIAEHGTLDWRIGTLISALTDLRQSVDSGVRVLEHIAGALDTIAAAAEAELGKP